MRPETDSAPRPIGGFRLGEWEVRPGRNQLVSEREVRHLEPKTMDLLVFITSSAPEVVSKSAIINSVWEGRIISEGTLTNTIAELRRALGDDARDPHYIETIPKRGYRLVAPIEAVLSSTGGDAQAPARWPGAVRVKLIVAVVLALAVVLTVVLRIRGRQIDPRLVLVGTFVNRTGDQTLDAAALLVRDRLVATLSESRLVSAVPVNVSGSGDTIDLLCAAARERGAGLAVGGTFYLHEGEVEVRAMLVDVGESAMLYAVPAATAEREKVSEALDQVVQRAVGGVATHLGAHAHLQLMSHTPVFAAYREFIAGSELFEVDRVASIPHFERALDLDPSFTSASFRLSVQYQNVGRHADAATVLARVEERRSDLTHFERLWLDYFLMRQDNRRRDRLVLLRQIEEAVPDDPVVQHMICGTEASLNRPRKTLVAASAVVGREARAGFLRNPIVIKTYRRCASSYHILGEYEKELRTARSGLELFPTNHGLLRAEACALTAMGDEAGFEEAIAKALSTAAGLTPAELLIEAAATARAHGRPDRGRELAGRALVVLDDRADPIQSFFECWLRGQALVLAGELERAQAVLETVRSMTGEGTAYQSLEVDGWLGVVAARRGDLETAQAIDSALSGIDGRQERGWPAHYRAAVAAWLGHRDHALELLRQSRAEGWGSFHSFHDSHRVLFEPLEGMREYEALLHPKE